MVFSSSLLLTPFCIGSTYNEKNNWIFYLVYIMRLYSKFFWRFSIDVNVQSILLVSWYVINTQTQNRGDQTDFRMADLWQYIKNEFLQIFFFSKIQDFPSVSLGPIRFEQFCVFVTSLLAWKKWQIFGLMQKFRLNFDRIDLFYLSLHHLPPSWSPLLYVWIDFDFCLSTKPKTLPLHRLFRSWLVRLMFTPSEEKRKKKTPLGGWKQQRCFRYAKIE